MPLLRTTEFRSPFGEIIPLRREEIERPIEYLGLLHFSQVTVADSFIDAAEQKQTALSLRSRRLETYMGSIEILKPIPARHFSEAYDISPALELQLWELAVFFEDECFDARRLAIGTHRSNFFPMFGGVAIAQVLIAPIGYDILLEFKSWNDVFFRSGSLVFLPCH